MKRLAFILVLLLPVLLTLRRPQTGTVLAASAGSRAYLIRFGIDGKPGVDWSGSAAGNGIRIEPWQFQPPEDRIEGPSWFCSTRSQVYWDTPYEREMRPTSHREKVTEKGIVLVLEGTAAREVQVKTRQGDFTLRSGFPPGSNVRSFLGGRLTVQAVPASLAATGSAEVEDYPALAEARDGSLWMVYQSYDGEADTILVKKFSNGAWSAPETIAPAGGDYFRTAIAQDGAGRMWVVWAARTGRNFDLFARSFDGRAWSAPERLTQAENSDIFHALAAASDGKLYLAYQSARSGNFDIYLRIFDGSRWGPERQVSSDPASDWQPVLAAAPDGSVTIVWDTYSRGNYDIVARTWRGGQLQPLVRLTSSGAFESRPAVGYDSRGRLWLAWDESDWNWGKDYGYQIPDNGRGLLTRRQTRVAVYEGGRLEETARPILNAIPAELRQVFHNPSLAIDGRGNPWVFFRVRTNLPELKAGGRFRGLWRLAATTYRDGAWSPMMEFPESYGRIDMALSAVRRGNGDIAVAWAPDGREWPLGRPQQQDLRWAVLPAGPPAAEPALTAYRPPTDDLAASHPREQQDIERIRAYRVRSGGHTWRIVRGDVHRHTDLSWDGNRDGSLDDSYRYALDAAGFDFLGVCDHQAGESIPYNWWRLQKAVDLYTIRDRFAPVYSYERSLNWPNGHRNVVFARRGNPVLEIPPEEAAGKQGATRLFEYLHRLGGISMPHTSASGMGTDWRDSDPQVEPLVEIYQGYRSNFETLGAPRSPTAAESKRFAAGFVWNAWAKGIKIGVQASSDHVSTHISYAGFFVARIDRDAILEAIKARRSFAATDNLFVETRMGSHFMGESFRAGQPMPLRVFVSGTGPLDRVEVIKNNRIVYSAPGNGQIASLSFRDAQAGAELKSYYYVRAVQKNGQICWSSPIWVERP